MKELIDVTIIGAGVVGLAIADALAAQNLQVVVLEKNDSFGQETSSRNSEVIHAGIYYPKKFLKSILCLEGNRLLYEWCTRHSVPHRRIGKLIVATNEGECSDLVRIKKTAEANGVEGLNLLSKTEILSKEPNVFALAALYSPNTGIVDSHRLMYSLVKSAVGKGAIITYRAKVTAIHFDNSAWNLEMNNNAYTIRTKKLINSAGLHADSIAALAGIDIDRAGYRLKPCKGSYFTCNPSPRLNHLIYPVPVTKNIGLGIHATLDLGGRVRYGPDSYYLPNKNNFDYAVDETLRPAFYKAIKRYLPSISMEALAPEMSGIRPKIQGPSDPMMDFIIQEESTQGCHGLINLIGIESPGLTSSLAIGVYIKKHFF